MAYSTQRVVSDGSLVLLSVSIGYLERAHIKVFFDNVENDALWDWVGATDNQITFTPAVPNGVEVLIARATDLSAPYHVFSQGAQFTAESLDEDIAQILYIAQEATEQALTAEFFQDVNMHGFQITNIADAVNPQDAMTLGQTVPLVQPYSDAAAASELAAAQSAFEADASADLAAGYAASINPASFATAAQGAKADTAVQPAALAGYATAAQGDKADTALQPVQIGSVVQAYGADIATVAATQLEMETGTGAALRSMSPLRIKQAITALAGSSKQIQPITASVAANALTITLNPTSLDFRSATLGSGSVNTRSVGAAISLTVPNTATLGTINAIQNRLLVLAIDNAGTVELAVVNIAGGNDISETGVITTTALSTGADSNNVIYSTTARTGVSYRVVGYVESTQATAGTWATAPSTIQGAGGVALAGMNSLGYGQTWQNVVGSRVAGTTYTNSTSRPISCFISGSGAGNGNLNIFVNGLNIATAYAVSSGNLGVSFIVPAGNTYYATISGATIGLWTELR